MFSDFKDMDMSCKLSLGDCGVVIDMDVLLPCCLV